LGWQCPNWSEAPSRPRCHTPGKKVKPEPRNRSIRRYFRGPTLSGVYDVQANQMRYYHFDHQGTTQCLTDQSGTVTDRFASDG
jgi:hypothetical protein